MTRQAVILAGGKGTRLAERLNGLPKPLVDVDGIPLLARQFDVLRRYGFARVVLLINHEADRIREFCASPAGDGLQITLIDDGTPKGTAGALCASHAELDDRFLVVYGDTLFDVDLDRLWSAHLQSGADATLMVHPNDHPQDSDLVELDEAGWIRGFHAYPHPPDTWLPNLVNAALYVIDRAAVDFWRLHPTPSDIARDLFPAMIERGAQIRGYVSFEYIKDVGTPARLDKAVRHLRSGLVRRASLGHHQQAVFLDRDGTINRLDGHLSDPQRFELLPGVAEAIHALNDAEYRVIIVTNQPVIARGECSVEQLRLIHNKLETLIGRQGAFIDRIYYCPHHPDRGFPGEVAALKFACNCRKPDTGMIRQAFAELNVDPGRSWLVGDSSGDMLMAQRCGLRSILVATGEGGNDGRYPTAAPDFTAADLPAAVTRILAHRADGATS